MQSTTEKLAEALRAVLDQRPRDCDSLDFAGAVMQGLREIEAYDGARLAQPVLVGEHTPEPWWVEPSKAGNPYWRNIASALNPEMFNVLERDARRIVACVNACSGISTDVLERARFAPADDETPLYELVAHHD